MGHLNWTMDVILPYANFVIFIFLLSRFGKKPVSDFFIERSTSFKTKMQAASLAKTQAEQKLLELNKELQGLDAKIAKMKQEAIAEAEERAARLVQNAEQVSQQILDDAKKVIEFEVLRAKNHLEKQVVEEVCKKVAHALTEKVGEEQLQSIVANRISRIAEAVT